MHNNYSSNFYKTEKLGARNRNCSCVSKELMNSLQKLEYNEIKFLKTT